MLCNSPVSTSRSHLRSKDLQRVLATEVVRVVVMAVTEVVVVVMAERCH